MADVDLGTMLSKLFYPDSSPFFGVDRSPLAATAAQMAWEHRGRWQRVKDWILRRRPPAGPRLLGFKFDVK